MYQRFYLNCTYFDGEYLLPQVGLEQYTHEVISRTWTNFREFIMETEKI